MNELGIIFALFGLVLIVAMSWVFCTTVFHMWLTNDWCRHNWGKWENSKSEYKDTQTRYCTKCNKKEVYVP